MLSKGHSVVSSEPHFYSMYTTLRGITLAQLAYQSIHAYLKAPCIYGWLLAE